MSKDMSKNKAANYLEYIPVPKRELKYEIKDGNVTIFRENKGIFCYITQKLLNKPKVSQIHLDEMGNFIWPLMDGTNDILAISSLVKERFGENAEPLYDRIVQYFKMLNNYGFIEFISYNNMK